jgi:hypothetical protein
MSILSTEFNSDTIHPKIKNLSYSSTVTLHRCPRKFQLEKLSEIETNRTSVTFSFGHCVGLGIQMVIEGKSMEDIIFSMYMMWDVDLLDEEEKSKKSFWYAIYAVQKFAALKDTTLLVDYELAYFNGEPAIELSFRISMMDGFKYRGFVDVVLKNKLTGEYLVLELKTTALRNVDDAIYKNSAQAIGYSLILDAIAPGLSSYKVLYLIYKSASMEFEFMPFDKSYSQRALWIQNMLMDVQMVEMYEASGIYPMHGESCYDFFRQCEYFGVCNLSTDKIVNLNLPYENVEKFTLELSLLDLLDAQISRNT